MLFTTDLESLVLQTAPPQHPDWLAYEKDVRSKLPQTVYASPLERQPAYAEECRRLFERMTGPGARDHHLHAGVDRRHIHVTSSLDGYQIPVLQLDLSDCKDKQPDLVIVYYHGGGLMVGEADSEELACRRMLKSMPERAIRLYSVGYRLKPLHPASVCHEDAWDGFQAFRNIAPRIVLAGSSSGGELATAVSQRAERGSIHGMLLRSPVTSDAVTSMENVPERLRRFHTSCSPSFVTALLALLQREQPRDGLEKLPLEASMEELQGLPRTWIQLCSNDTLYSDGLCYAIALRDAGVEVQVNVMEGWPHTFWLKAPEMPQALEADEALLEGLRWVVQ